MTLGDAGARFSKGGTPHAMPHSRTLPPSGAAESPVWLWRKPRAVPSLSGGSWPPRSARGAPMSTAEAGRGGL